jgi:hypothetical protein
MGANDFQLSRTSAAQVASGGGSFIGGGSENIASGGNSVVAGGNSNDASANYSAIGGGDNNTASNNLATVAGGDNNNATGHSSAVGGGGFNTASGSASTVGGGSNNLASGNASAVPGGAGNTAQSYGEIVIGLNATIGAGTYNSYVSTDRLFVVGNGTGMGSRSDALVMLKNGNTTISGTLSASNLSGTNTGDQTITLTGDVTGSGTGSFATTVATVGGVTAANVASGANAANAASAIQTVSADYIATSANGTILVDCNGASRTIALPAANTMTGRKLVIKKIDAGAFNVVIDGDNAETIDAALTQTLATQWLVMVIQSNGTSWYIVN